MTHLQKIINKVVNIKEKISKLGIHTSYINHFTGYINKINYDNFNYNDNRIFTKNIVKNYINKDQFYYNIIVNSSIKKIKDILSIELKNNLVTRDIFSAYEMYYFYLKQIRHLNIIFNDYINEYNKLIYLLYYLGIQRQLIYLFQLDNITINNLKLKYGHIHQNFYKDTKYEIIHKISMSRFDNYVERINNNIKKLKELNVEYVKISKESNNEIIKIFFNINFEEFKEIELKINDNNNIFMKITLDKNIRNSNLGNESYYTSRLNYLNILSQCLYHLNKNDISIENKKKYILIFYYVMILLMPYESGTASISEMLLYSLWEKYINKTINIKNNIMLDVEALTLPFDIFYENCISKSNNDTPYLYEIDFKKINKKNKETICNLLKI